jgi:putative alpha-1,2-mannosidase
VKPVFSERGLKFNHSGEKSTASYYSVHLQEPLTGSNIFAELSGVSRAGIMRFSFPSNSSPFVVIQATRQGVAGQITVDPKSREIYGWNPERQDSNLGPNKAADFKGYFVARFEESFERYGTALNSTLNYGNLAESGETLSAFVEFAAEITTVRVKVGVSFISIDQARYNLDMEIPDGLSVEDVSNITAAAWNEKLDLITLTNAKSDGSFHNEMETFYTAMFHALQYPNEMMEPLPPKNRVSSVPLEAQQYWYYSGYDNRVHIGEAYTSYSIWDTFRAEWAWLNLFAPERINSMITSMLQVSFVGAVAAAAARMIFKGSILAGEYVHIYRFYSLLLFCVN